MGLILNKGGRAEEQGRSRKRRRGREEEDGGQDKVVGNEVWEAPNGCKGTFKFEYPTT